MKCVEGRVRVECRDFDLIATRFASKRRTAPSRDDIRHHPPPVACNNMYICSNALAFLLLRPNNESTTLPGAASPVKVCFTTTSTTITVGR
jgi:hypothetical protein